MLYLWGDLKLFWMGMNGFEKIRKFYGSSRLIVLSLSKSVS